MAAMSIPACLAHWSSRKSDEVAVIDDKRRITWRELDLYTNQLARSYAAQGVAKGDFVAVMLPNCLEVYEAAFAAWKLGATVFPVSSRMPAMEREALLDLVKPKLMIDKAEHPELTMPDAPLPDCISPNWKALASGGSTGRPKVIVSMERGCFDPAVPDFCMETEGAMLVAGPLYHNASFMFSSRALFVGKQVVVMPRFDAEQTLQLIERHRIDWTVMVPTMMQRIWKLPEETRVSYDISSLKTLLHTAAICPDWLKRAWIDWIGPDAVQEIYGGTEGCGTCWISGSEWLEKPGSVGRPLPEFRLRIANIEGDEVPAGEIGNIFMRPLAGPGTTSYYLGAEPMRHSDGWEWIGDIGHCDKDGYLFLADRRTDLIIAGGANIYPAEVEAAIDRFPCVRSCAVIGLPDEDMGARIHAIVETKQEIDEAELREHLLAWLVAYKIPRTFEFVTAPLRDEAGKVRRSALREARMKHPA